MFGRLVAAAISWGLTLGVVQASPLPGIDPAGITVSGISAGAEMAHQLHIAYPDVFTGAAIIGGGPFGCAQGSLATALGQCMTHAGEEIPLPMWLRQIREGAADGRAGPTELLRDDRVWIFHGSLDEAMDVRLSEALVNLYAALMPARNVSYVHDIPAAHTFPTTDAGGECGSSVAPFIGRCGYDAAGELLQYLYGDLKTPRAEVLTALREVQLTGADEAGLDATAYLYVPSACSRARRPCRLHLVLHGCGQAASQVGRVFMEKSGYLRWAEANGIVLAFPQVTPAAANPYACWDWWGYTGAGYRWRGGAQMQLLVHWIKSL